MPRGSISKSRMRGTISLSHNSYMEKRCGRRYTQIKTLISSLFIGVHQHLSMLNTYGSFPALEPKGFGHRVGHGSRAPKLDGARAGVIIPQSPLTAFRGKGLKGLSF